MAHSSAAGSVHGTPISARQVVWLVAASLLIGVGLFVITYFMLTFQLVYLGGTGMVVLGGLMLFDRRAGPDHA